MNCYKCATPIPDNSRFCSACGADVSGDSHAHVGDTLAVEQDQELLNRLQAELGTEYVLERELGRGGMAVVYLGHDAHLNRKIAVKVLPPELTYGSSSMVERFKREAQTAAKLDHPNIIPVHRVSPGGKLFWYVMKYLDGEALDDILERECQLPVERTVDIVSQVAAALDYAHQNKVVHRDVKPANVIIDKKGWCTVTDFGIAKALDANTLTASGSIIGTPYYMSPEQCTGKRVGPAADQYSLAVMTYQMLGGHVPFTGDSAVEIVHKHVADPVPPLGVLRPNLSDKVIQVVERGLAKTAEERFATVADYARALKAASQGLDITVAPPGRPGPMRMSKTALVSPVPGALRTAKGTWRDRKGLVFGGIGGVVAVGAAAALLVVQPWVRPVSESPSDSSFVGREFAGGPAVPSAPAAQPRITDTAGGAGAPAATPPAGAAVSAPQPAAAAPAHVDLRGVPAGASVRLDGRAVRGASFDVSSGAHRVAVVAAGYEPWSRAVTPQPGESLSVTVTMRRAAPGGQVATPGGQQPAVRQAAPAGAQPAPQPGPAAAPTVQPSPQAPSGAAQAVGYLSVGTNPVSTIYVNGVPRGSRLREFEVPPGEVRLRFQVQDSTGIWWAQDRTVSVAPGQRLMLGYIQLVRP